MNIAELDKQIKNKSMHGIYLLYGENIFSLDSYIKKIKKSFGELVQGINYINIDENSVENLISDISTPAFRF